MYSFLFVVVFSSFSLSLSFYVSICGACMCLFTCLLLLLAIGMDCFCSFDILLLQDVRVEVSITSRYLEVFFLCHVNASYIKCVEVILEAHASPNLVNANGETPLMLAVNAGWGANGKDKVHLG